MPRQETDIEEQVTKGIDDFEAAQAPSVTDTKAAEPKTPEQPAPDDPEIELDGGKKVRMSDLKKGYMMQSDYTTKTQALAEQKKEVEELANLAQYLKANPAKLQRIIAVLDEKEEAIAEKKEEIKDEMAGLEPTDPLNKALKAQAKMLSDLQKQIADMKKGQEMAEKETLVKQAQQVLTKTMDESAKGYAFEDDEEKELWRKMVLSHLKDNPKEYKDESDFTNNIKEIGRKYFDTIAKIAEKRVAKYVKTKSGSVPTTPSVPGSPISKKPSMEDLQEIIEEELLKEEATNKQE